MEGGDRPLLDSEKRHHAEKRRYGRPSWDDAPALDEALYATRVGTVNGPIKTEQAWYVFQLSSIDPLPPQSLAQARDAIAAKLGMRRQERARRLLERRLLTRYRPLTLCAQGLRLPQCSNSPSAKGDSMSLLHL